MRTRVHFGQKRIYERVGVNSTLMKQKAEDGEAIVTTALFDHGYELLHDRIDIQAVLPITEAEYQVGGNTALIDAIGMTIHKIKKAQKHTAEDFRPERTLFVIITDGVENSSRRFTAKQVKALIEHHREKHGWEFIFLGANIDAAQTARHFGINQENSQNYHADGAGLSTSYAGIMAAVSTFRNEGHVGKAWVDIIARDFDSRNK